MEKIKIVKWAFFSYIVLGNINGVLFLLLLVSQVGYSLGIGAAGFIFATILHVLIAYYLLFKCQYKWIKKIFNKHPSTDTTLQQNRLGVSSK